VGRRRHHGAVIDEVELSLARFDYEQALAAPSALRAQPA
jgi:hypothetical protein